MNIADLFDLDLFQQMQDDGMVRSSRHPVYPLATYGYTEVCAFSRTWNEVTSACRGLIVEDGGMVIARPYAKFHNYGETLVPQYVLNTPPTVVHDKLDGSLGIIYTYDGQNHVATKGSFLSDQAVWASGWLTGAFPEFRQPEGVTTLVEIIYPENRIVVSYEDREELVLLGAINIETGADIPMWEIDWWEGARATQYTGLGDADEIYRFATGNDKEEDEGVVATWYRPGASSFRLKYKHPTYISRHRLVTGTTKRSVWEALSRGEDPSDIEDRVDEDFLVWLRATIADLRTQHADIEFAACAEFATLSHLVEDRKAFAMEAAKSPNRAYLFALLDGKDIVPMIWRTMKPEHERAHWQARGEE